MIPVKIAAAAARFPERIAVERMQTGGLHATTYRDLLQAADGWSDWLTGQGLMPGDRAAILGDNDAGWIAAYLGVLSVGGVAVPLDTAYSAPQVHTVLKDSGARWLFTTSRYLKTAREAVARLEHRAAEIMSSDAPPPRTKPATRPPLSTDDVAVILYTSGTTSDPKGVVLTHGNLDAECVAALDVFRCTEEDVVLGVLPLFHSLAQLANLLLPLSVGGRVVFLDTVSSSSLLAALQQRGVTLFACVPQFFYLIHQRVMSEVAKSSALRRGLFRTMLRTNGWLRNRFGWNPGVRWFARVHRTLGSRIRALISGGSRFDPAIGRDLYDLGFTIVNGYGLTETSGAATVQRPGDRFTASVGQPLNGVQVKIAPRQHDNPHGEILISGPIVMRGYFNRPEATSEALQDGWLHTGDLGEIDAQGRVFITGRQKEIIVLSSGKNLYPEEIESHYRQSTVIKELCVLGLTPPGQPSAERLHAVIVPDEAVLRERGVVNFRELIRFELEGQSVHLPAHKRILTYDIRMEPLPRTTTGKLRRHEIERLVQLGEHDAGPATRVLSPEEEEWLRRPERAALVELIAGRLTPRAIRPDANLELDLGLDSLERVELLTALEQRAGTSVAPEARAAIFNVRQLVDVVLGSATTREGPNLAAAELPWSSLLTATPEDAHITHNLTRQKLIRTLAFFIVVRVLRLVVALIPGLRAGGTHHLPRDGAFIICPNHQSYLDGFFVAASLPWHAFRRLFFVGASEYFQTPGMRWLAASANILPVDPDANLVSAMQAGAAGLRAKKVLLLFPEGERSIDGELKKFRNGAAIISAHVGAPMVPTALDGLYPIWPRSRPFQWRALLPGRSQPILLRFGAPVTAAVGAYAAATAAIHSATATMLDEIRR
jgi:long-chain acyl-CoA synthetase